MALLHAPVLSGNAVERPATGNFVGQVFVAIDTGAASIWDGSAWAASGGGSGGSAFAVRTASPPFRAYPHNAATGGGVTTSGVANTWTTPFQISSSTPANFLASMLHINLYVEPKTSTFLRLIWEFELMTGASSSEVPIAALSGSFVTQVPDFAGGTTILGGGRSFRIGPDLIASGTRLSYRARISIADTTATLNARAYVSGYDNDAPASDPTHNLDDYVDGLKNSSSKLQPSGATNNINPDVFGTWGTPVQFIASAPSALLVRGVVVGDSGGLAQSGHYVQFGVGPGGSETWYEALAVPARQFLNGGDYELARPFLVLSGERVVATRARWRSEHPAQAEV